jgi:hypothetical protein
VLSSNEYHFNSFDDVIEENNRLIVKEGGPRFSTPEEDAEMARLVKKIKQEEKAKQTGTNNHSKSQSH